MNNKREIEVIAFYLPQYHPIKENNKWFGEGFTEWTNVGKAKPLFKGHYQPKVPADLGYYDLRIPEVRKKQAELAKKAGISAFCYYHYWFGNGRQIMEMPLNEVVQTGEPDFPFCICWANHSFYRKNWDNRTKVLNQELLLEQTYPGEQDFINHFHSLLPAFKDKRYLRIDDRLIFVIYEAKKIENFAEMKLIWNDLAKKNGLPKFFFTAYSSSVHDIENNKFAEFDAVIFTPLNKVFIGELSNYRKVNIKLKTLFSHVFKHNLNIKEYKNVINDLTDPIEERENVFPAILPNWDLTPRRGYGASILTGSTPALFNKHVRNALKLLEHKPANRKVIFLKSWNEWGEGNYMEPDLVFGHGYLKALQSALEDKE